MKSRALIAESSIAVSSVLRKYLESAGLEVRAAHDLDEAMRRAREAPPDIVFTSCSSAFDGESLCVKLKELVPQCPVVLMYPPEEEDPAEHAARVGADGYLVGPLKRGTVVSTAQSMLRIRELRLIVERLEREAKRQASNDAEDELKRSDGSPADFEFFKKYLLMEVKRSRRYRYPTTFLLIAFDDLASRLIGSVQSLKLALRAEAVSACAKTLRDIDLVVPYSQDRLLIFLPHTGREGAMIAAARIQAQLSRLKTLEGLTTSIGIAAYEPVDARPSVGFGALMKEAHEALAQAQKNGPGRIEAFGGVRSKRSRIVIA